MKSLLNASDFVILGSIGLVVLAIAVAFGVLSLLASVWKWVLVHRYLKYNKQNVAVNMTGAQVAEKMLEGLGINDVKVEKLGFWKSLFITNSYNPRKKAIRLRKNIYDKTSLTSVALAAQKVAIAHRHHEGDKKIVMRLTLTRFGYFAPFALIPLILIGILLDFVIWNSFNWLSITFTAVAFVYFIVSFIIVILNLKIEKAACNKAVEFMQKANVLTEDEMEDARRLYKTYITDYWIEFLYNLFFIVWEFIKLFGRVLAAKKR